MAVTGWEMIVVAGVLIIFFLWGPNKIPQLARAIGQAKSEYDKAARELTRLPTTDTSAPSSVPAPVRAPDDALITTAKRLGIPTEGKTRDEISKLIVDKATAQKPQTTT